MSNKEIIKVLKGKEYSNKNIRKAYIPDEFLKEHPELLSFIETEKKFWQEEGFKRTLASVFYTVGTGLMAIEPKTAVIFLALGAAFGVTGIADAQRKEKARGQRTILVLVTELLSMLLKSIINKTRGKNGN